MKIADETLQDLQRLGLSPSQALHMAECAAPYTDPNGNRRYESFVFDIEDDTVHAISLIGEHFDDAGVASNCNSTACPDCDTPGEFCMTCNGTGAVGPDKFNT